MAFYDVTIGGFTHSSAPGCACPGCCLDLADDTQSGGAQGGDRAAVAIGKLIDLGLLDQVGGARWSDQAADGEGPQRADQQATASFFPYDTDTGDADQGVDGLISGSAWDQTALTYSFPTSASDYESNYYNAGALATLSGFNSTQMSVSRDAFAQYAAISGLTFTELGDDPGEQKIDADLRLARSDDPSTAYAYYPNDNPVGGDSMFNTNNYNSPEIGNYAYHTFLHEIGHALGLKHGHDTSGAGAVPYDMDSMEYTVMTYRSWVGKPLTYGYANETWGYSQSLMMLDIAAIQRMYGANFDTNSGNTLYTFSTSTGEMFIDGVGAGTPGGNRIFRTIWDGDGTDTYDFSNYTTNLSVDLAPGSYVDLDVGGNFQRAKLEFGYQGNPVTYSRGHVFNAMQYEGDARSLIENAKGGSGNDSFFGNAADNVFHGNAGNDTFHASLGSDTYYGDFGFDTVEFDQAFSAYSFSTSGTFLLVTDSATDWLADTIESVVFFGGETWSFGDLYDLASGNTSPDAVDDSYNVDEDIVLSGWNVLSNDTDPESDPLTVSAVNGQASAVGTQITLASGALLTVNANGTFSYDQNGAFDHLGVGQTGIDSFTYSASDGVGSDTATVTINIDGAFDNTPPNAVNDSYNAAEGDPINGNVTSNDSDADGDPVTVTAVNGQSANVGVQITLASGALLTLNGDGSFSYDQNSAFDGLEDGQTGNDSFTYSVSDGQGGSDSATVSITIDGVSPPTASEPVTIDFEADQVGPYAGTDDLAFAGLNVEAGSALNGLRLGASGADGDFTITALGGDFDFDSAVFRAVSGRVRVTIEAWDDGVLVGTDAFNARSNRDSQRNFDSTFDSVDEIRVISNGAIFVDDLDFVVYSEIGPGGNSPPVAVDDAFSTAESAVYSGDAVANDSDLDGDPITVTSFAGGTAPGATATLASGATVTMQSDGTFDYDPNNAFDDLYDGESALDSFTYTVADGMGGSDTATVTMTVNGEGTPPPAPQQTVIDFESGVPTADFVFTDTVITTRAKGVVSGSQAGQSDGDSMAFSRVDSFDFDSGYFTAVDGKKVTVTVDGYLGGSLVGSQEFTVSDKRESLHSLDDAIFDDVDQVVITASGGVIVDDLTLYG